MYPVLAQIGSFTIYSFSLFVVVAILTSGYFIWKNAQEFDLETDKVFDFVIISLVGGLVGGRIFNVVLHWNKFSQDPLTIIFVRGVPGLSFWGILAGAALVGYFYCKSKKLAFLKFADCVTYGLSFSQIIIFLGHIFAGSFYGLETNFFWGIRIADSAVARHPTQFIGLLFSIILFFAVRKFSKRIHFSGFIILFWLASNSLFLFLVDWLRVDGVYLGRISVNQIFALVAFFIFTALFYHRTNHRFGSDARSFIKFWFIFAKSIVYLAQKSEARKNLITNTKFWISKKLFAVSARISANLSNFKELIDVKKSKSNRH